MFHTTLHTRRVYRKRVKRSNCRGLSKRKCSKRCRYVSGKRLRYCRRKRNLSKRYKVLKRRGRLNNNNNN